MCVTFWFTREPGDNHPYKLILAFNRDEFYNRPTKEAEFWNTTPSILAGKDLERERSTWAGVTKTGKIGMLLNILNSGPKDGKESRGNLVVDYLLSSQSGPEYLTEVSQRMDRYNPFHLITIEKGNDGEFHSFKISGEEHVEELPSGINSLGNNTPTRCLFQKVQQNIPRFKEIVVKAKDLPRPELVSDLMSMLQNRTRYECEQTRSQGQHLAPAYVSGLQSIFVELPGYGTRTHTIILITQDDHLHYFEKTLEKKKWIDKEYSFLIQDT